MRVLWRFVIEPQATKLINGLHVFTHCKPSCFVKPQAAVGTRPPPRLKPHQPGPSPANWSSPLLGTNDGRPTINGSTEPSAATSLRA